MPCITVEHANYVDFTRKRYEMMRKDELEDALPRAYNRLRKKRPLVRSRETIAIHDITGVKDGRTISVNARP
jgi:hypothetical protein